MATTLNPLLLLLVALVLLPLRSDASDPGDTTGQKDNNSSLAALRVHATLYSIAIEWDIVGDANHNAVCKTQYRVAGKEGAWKEALPLFRVDYYGWYNGRKAERGYNMFAGSILFLEPGTTYEVKLDAADPDGFESSKTVTATTRPLPTLPTGGKTYHVVPGEGGGDGSEQRPFQGLAAAQLAAQPGDVVLLRPGNYGSFEFDKPGMPGKFIAWKKTGEGSAVFDSVRLRASHLYLEGLSFKKNQATTAFKAEGPTRDVVVCKCDFVGFHHSLLLSKESQDWYIADNLIEGDNVPDQSTLHGEGIDLAHSSGHTVEHNRVSRTENGVHYPGRNCDIVGNDIFDTSDDGIEPDYGYCNIRIWNNRIANYKNNGLSFQPMYCGPWYFIRNQVIGIGYIFKFRVQDRFVLVNNTFVTWGMISPRMHHLLTSLSRNNLYIYAGTKSKGPLWVASSSKDNDDHVRKIDFKPNWMTDVDYDGFDWGGGPLAVRWDKTSYKDLKTFAAEVGIEKHAVRVHKHEIFDDYKIPSEPTRVGPVQLTLKSGSNAIDAGAALPNVCDVYEGKAPDLGAHEFGRPPIVYGPRQLKRR